MDDDAILPGHEAREVVHPRVKLPEVSLSDERSTVRGGVDEKLRDPLHGGQVLVQHHLVSLVHQPLLEQVLVVAVVAPV